jgi:hypothetical protein
VRNSRKTDLTVLKLHTRYNSMSVKTDTAVFLLLHYVAVIYRGTELSEEHTAHVFKLKCSWSAYQATCPYPTAYIIKKISLYTSPACSHNCPQNSDCCQYVFNRYNIFVVHRQDQ